MWGYGRQNPKGGKMRVLRTALALGALAMSAPVMAQGNRYGWDRSRADGNRDAQGGRSDNKGNGRVAQRSESRNDNRNDNRGQGRIDNRGAGRNNDRFGTSPGRSSDERYERREDPRVVVRSPAG